MENLPTNSCELEFAPLSYPTPWPPPKLTERSKWHRVPILGWIVCEIHRDFVGDRVARGIHRDIVAQLNGRPSTTPAWPVEPRERQVVEALGKAVAGEKDLQGKSVALHPDDPVVLLLWGEFDDLTPVIFSSSIENDVGIDLDCSTLGRCLISGVPATESPDRNALNSRMTVFELVSLVVACPPNSKPKRKRWFQR